MGKHMCILPLSYISEAANLLWLPVGKPGVSSHQSSRLLPIRGASSPPSRPWPPCCDTLTQAGALPAPVTYLLTTVCAASCQPANPGSRRPDRCIGSLGAAFSSPTRPLQHKQQLLAHGRGKIRAGAPGANNRVARRLGPAASTKKKGMPRSVAVAFPLQPVRAWPLSGNTCP